MGGLRYLLSLAVLVSHMGVGLLGFNPGVVAVVVFYMLSGFVVQTLLSKRFAGPAQCWAFYQDRAWRIMPMYLVAALLAWLLWLQGAVSPFLSATPDSLVWLSNLTIIPLNYYMYSGVSSFTLLPPAWSLGAELQFYLLAPLLALLPCRYWWGLFAASVLIFVLAQLGILNTDHAGYRLLPGVLFVFMLGMLLAGGRAGAAICRWLPLAVVAAAVLYLLLLYVLALHRPFDREVAAGLMLGVPLVVLMSRQTWRGRAQQLNRMAGNLAYGVFLLHFPMIWVVELYGLPGNPVLWVIVLSTLAAGLGYWLVEKPLWQRFRALH